MGLGMKWVVKETKLLNNKAPHHCCKSTFSIVMMKLLASDGFILQPVLSVHSYVLSVVCVPLTTYPQDFDTFLLAHKVNSK